MNKNDIKIYTRRLLIIAVPLILSNVISQLQMLIDRMFLGHANNLYMSALGNATSPMWTSMSFCFSLATGASILISQSVGAGDKDKIEEYAGAVLKYNNIIPILMFVFWTFFPEPVFRLMGVSENVMPMCVTYTRLYAPVFLMTGIGSGITVIMQTSNYTTPEVGYGLIRSILNIILDWVMIFGHLGCPAMGIKGAAIATTISEFAGGFFMLGVFIFSKKFTTRPSMQSIIKSKFSTYWVSAKLGVNTALEDFAWNIGNLVIIVILNAIDEMAAGIYSIVFGIEIVAVVVVAALGSGTMTLTGEAKGEKNVKLYRGVTFTAYAMCVISIIITTIFCIAIPEAIIGLFTNDQSIISTSSIYLLMISLNLFAKSGNIIIGNSIRGSGDTKWMLYTQMFGTVFIISVAALLVFVVKLGIMGVFLAVMLDEATRAIINLMRYLRIVKRWKD